ncbi:uncharacterized protein LOC126914745 [Bombus affinis]|uniref:uncharacterized protein LOC126914745 n=1 Tax=Bombus affinis TaxID=309941 RepID=UPI0021B71F84|nr:uncharacterized protein LOC126914745 [Bombus affinis]XP_050575091.1 uncharacterized protein LOC126914745 [Bombus affinis]XP_050575092.1 uncharacterized protein LOC126914745 [Bombus affinis]
MYSTMMIGTVFYAINFTELLTVPDLHLLPIWMQTIVNQKFLRYISYCIFCTVMFLANATSIAAGSISTMTFQHLRSLFEIASNRIKEAFIYNSLHDSTSSKTFKMTESLKSSIYLHVKCMKVLLYLKQTYMVLSFLLCGFGVLILGISLFLCFQSYLLHRINYVLLYIIISMIEIVCLFRVNYTTQTMLDAYNNVFVELYNIEWYEAPLHVQKIILFMMLKYSFPLSFNMFGVFSACMEGFSSLAKMTVSYFMVIYSTMR